MYFKKYIFWIETNYAKSFKYIVWKLYSTTFSLPKILTIKFTKQNFSYQIRNRFYIEKISWFYENIERIKTGFTGKLRNKPVHQENEPILHVLVDRERKNGYRYSTSRE